MSLALQSSECSSSARQQKQNVQAWVELDTSLQIMFKLELVIKYKILSLASLGLIHWSSQARAQYQAQTQARYHAFELEIPHKYIIKSIYQVYYLTYLVWMSGLNL